MGSCLVTEDSSSNLGSVQISPQVGANGSLTLVYVNGDKCKNQRFSTRINLECAHTTVRVRAAPFCLPQTPGPVSDAEFAQVFRGFRLLMGSDQSVLVWCVP